MGLNVYDLGDAAPLRLEVEPADGTTLATVEITRPDGSTFPLSAAPTPARTEWTTTLVCTAPGLWRARWTVTGLGAGAETRTLAVRGAPARRGYATSGDLAGWVDVIPGNADALLAAAERVVDRLMVGAVWEPVSATDRRPAIDPMRAAYRDATCAQAAAWIEHGAGDDGPEDPDDAGADADELARFAAVAGVTSMSFGPVTFGLKASGSGAPGSDATSGPDLDAPAPAAVSVLQAAGVWPPRVALRR